MPFLKKKGVVITTIFWFWLLYITAALVFWYLSLMSQNAEMAELRMRLKSPDHPDYSGLVTDTLALQKRKQAQYTGEGVIFLLLLLGGAVFVYRATRRQWRLSIQQQNFMMAVTHELKTPISVVRLNMETIKKRSLESAVRERMILQTLQDVDRLDDLCNNILLASRLDAGRYQMHIEPVHFNDLVSQCFLQFKARFPQRVFNLQMDEGITVNGEQMLLKMLINNLLDNAVKYSPKNKPISVGLKKMSEKLHLTVADEGPGIPENEKKKVFRKFYRQGSENTRAAKGTGLGLYLCKKIVRDHKARMQLTDNVPTGCIFTIIFNY